MRPLKSVETDDSTALIMENELFRHEIAHLRGRLSAAQSAQRDRAREVRRLEGIIQSRGLEVKGGAVKKIESDRSHNDLVWFLRRLDSSAVGWLIRIYPGFRTLKKRYLGADK